MDRSSFEELVALVAEDARVREELFREGSLSEGYHPRMEAVHRHNAARLRAIVEEHGWPVPSIAGEEAAEAAWLIAQHAIGEPELMRAALSAIERAVERGDAPAWQAAYLHDRICALEGRLQRYGTQFGWTDAGVLDIDPDVEDRAELDRRRASIGLRPIAEALESVRDRGDRPPSDLAEYRRGMHDWAVKVGWRRR